MEILNPSGHKSEEYFIKRKYYFNICKFSQNASSGAL